MLDGLVMPSEPCINTLSLFCAHLQEFTDYLCRRDGDKGLQLPSFVASSQ